MPTFQYLETKLRSLEQQHFMLISAEIPSLSGLPITEHISGGVQFGVIDDLHKQNSENMPVVCAIGINYTQKDQVPNNLYSYTGGNSTNILVSSKTGCNLATALVIAAYNRNKSSWENPPPGVKPVSTNGRYGSANATDTSQLLAPDAQNIKQSFILIMTNFCPFITRKKWSEINNVDVQNALLATYNNSQYLDDLFRAIGADVDLWIGHSAIYGTDWVWPKFNEFVNHNGIEHWLLTPNLNPQAHLYIQGPFAQEGHPLYSLFRMSISFRVESNRVGTEEATVKLYKRISSEAPVQIRQEIALCDDHLDESGQFLLHGPGDWHKSVCVHLVGNLLSAPEDAESIVAWYATIGFGSFELQARWKGSEIFDAVERQKSIDVTAQSIVETLGIAEAERGTRFLSLSHGAIEYFLLGELHKNRSKIGSVRERIKEQTTKYLKQLRFRSDVVEAVQNEIDRLDCEFLKDFESSIAEDPNFPHTWCNYFRTLDSSDLSLFHPSKPIPFKRAYATIRAWYQTAKPNTLTRFPGQAIRLKRSRKLIDALPPVHTATHIEIISVFREVLMGRLEWAFNESDGIHQMSEYAKQGLYNPPFSLTVTPNESAQLQTSPLWRHLSRHVRSWPPKSIIFTIDATKRRRTLIGPTTAIARRIVLFDDPRDRSDELSFDDSNSEQSIYAHILAELLPKPDSSESVVAWSAMLEFASYVLPHEFPPVPEGQLRMLSDETILNVLETETHDPSRFPLRSGPAINTFLLRVLHTNTSILDRARNSIRDNAVSYLQQLLFPAKVIEDVRTEIEKTDRAVIETHGERIGEILSTDRYFRYFYNLKPSDS